MRVAVLGSWREEDRKKWRLRESPDGFRAACRQVGAELIRQGHSLIVGTDSEHTADANAVLGAVDALQTFGVPPEWPRILLIRPATPEKARPFEQLRRSLPGAGSARTTTQPTASHTSR